MDFKVPFLFGFRQDRKKQVSPAAVSTDDPEPAPLIDEFNLKNAFNNFTYYGSRLLEKTLKVNLFQRLDGDFLRFIL